MTDDEMLMQLAIEQAKKAYRLNEVPIGAVVVKDGEVVGTGYNRRETGKNALYHAELEAIDAACKKLGGWRLWQCEIYVTLEPCPMCAGAIINSRLKRVVYGCEDYKAGSVKSVINLFELPYNHKPEYIGGVLRQECSSLLTDFFRELREKKKSY
ncbi:MAG: tRNA adenosine(34) deaminase TadA [Clostridia bacterium]|nr:tRNA adenosine(34) deaminase TadA [Clostridia bacterium]